MGTVAKVLAGIGALVLLAAGGCFLALNDAFGNNDMTLWVIGTVLLVAGVIAVIALLGHLRRE